MSSTLLDLPLDEIIKRKRGDSHGQRRGRGARRGGFRNNGLAGIQKTTVSGPLRRTRGTTRRLQAPYVRRDQVDFEDNTLESESDGIWEHDLYEEEEEEGVVDQMEGLDNSLFQNQGRGTGTTISVSNLDYAVSEQDLKDLFATVGIVRKAAIKFDRSGRSEGVAKVVFSSNTEALAAIKKYDGVSLDNHPLSISLLSSAARNTSNGRSGTDNGRNRNHTDHVRNSDRNIDSFVSRRLVTSDRNSHNIQVSRGFGGRGRFPSFRGRSFNRGGRGRGGRGGSRNNNSGGSISTDSLDAELDRYQQQQG